MLIGHPSGEEAAVLIKSHKVASPSVLWDSVGESWGRKGNAGCGVGNGLEEGCVWR